ncbi:MAG: acetyl-CoA carboxylase biotin carboxyl carrier protein subunit [Bacteroidota bacterium]|nr:acetyl-CoA carboxylase biotin carboxyl carrier protein subunit [Bacteroidota bacterium]MDP4225361.1 acetyl-CoA carboxylase biotin carboxyl carrier protein subunit [Bacteroidota bacterium]MDP4274966.1 acetyl-CoA carboxylase biotin carboxyl carrier protein subunit [Bacteroidota bacterium]
MIESNQKTGILNIDGTLYETNLTKKYLERKPWTEPDKRQYVSHIPGTVVQIMVKEGQQVKKGTPMIILEAMKMNNIALVPIDGTVKKIYVTEGQKIPKGTLMIEFE